MKIFLKSALTLAALVLSAYQLYSGWFGESELGESIKVNGTEIFYSDIDTTEVRKLADYLQESAFADGTEKSVRIQKTQEAYLFGGVYDESVWNDSSYISSGYEYAKELSLYVFDSEPVSFQFCDDELVAQNETLFDIREFPYGWEFAFGEIQLFFTSRVGYQEANKLGEFLTNEGLSDYSMTIQLDKSDSAYHYNQVTLEEFWFDDEYLITFEESANEISQLVFEGAPVVYTLCDDELNPQRSVMSN